MPEEKSEFLVKIIEVPILGPRISCSELQATSLPSLKISPDDLPVQVSTSWLCIELHRILKNANVVGQRNTLNPKRFSERRVSRAGPEEQKSTSHMIVKKESRCRSGRETSRTKTPYETK